jgi:NAD(P)-dependent dehydrogenase (short-subunit alcohol dehydrogenase family)
MDMLLKGKRALITGSTSGIGAQCARVLAGEGVSVVINGRSADRAAAVTEEIRKVGGEAKFVLGDVTTEDVWFFPKRAVSAPSAWIVVCPSCERVHFVNRQTRKLLGHKD